MIKKIKNLKYSPSKNKEATVLVELKSELKNMLTETDWTQLPDVDMSLKSRYDWMLWRARVRALRKDVTMSLVEFTTLADKLKDDRVSIITDHNVFSSVEAGKEYLYKLLVSKYNDRINAKFPPTIDAKYTEVLDMIADYVSKNTEHLEMTKLPIGELISYIQDMPPIIMDTSGYPFFKLTMELNSTSVNWTMVHILQRKLDMFEFTLQEDYNLIHYEHKISSCNTVDEIPDIKMEIELNYDD